jgi:hypothetical protein
MSEVPASTASFVPDTQHHDDGAYEYMPQHFFTACCFCAENISQVSAALPANSSYLIIF